MGTSAGKSAVSSVANSPGKLVNDPKNWLATDGQNLALAATGAGLYQNAAPIYAANTVAQAAGGTLDGKTVGSNIPGFAATSAGVQYATRGAGGSDTPPDIPVADSPSLLPTKKKRNTQNRAGTMLTDANMGADLSTNLGNMGGRSTLLGL